MVRSSSSGVEGCEAECFEGPDGREEEVVDKGGRVVVAVDREALELEGNPAVGRRAPSRCPNRGELLEVY